MAKSKWPKLPRYFVPLFHSANVYLARSREEYAQACEHLKVDVGSLNSLAGTCRHYQNEDTNENLYLIGVFNGDIATLVHECAHATFYCCHDVGVVIEAHKANETYCYLLDRMFSHFLPHIKQE
ncbi:hypothetical protein ACVV7N_004111 [Cronobacter sakazakii]|nr:hypothetical protein [Cronobacter sakazakii]MDI9301463.1 hypothetical protein [Cronobacter sakazakii]MDI9352366.1 hypothetical protein [Cronobacter sakazakii]